MKEKKETKSKKVKKTVKFDKLKNLTKSKKVISKEKAAPEKKSASFSLVEMIVAVIAVALVVSVLSGYLVFKNYNYISSKATDEVSSKDLTNFINVYKELKEKYVEDIKDEELINAAIDGMLDYLDVYTDYLDKDTTTDLQDRLNGEYKGIGVEISSNTEGNVYIVNVFEDTPAEKAGLKAGDVIIEINGASMLGKTPAEVAATIKSSSVSSIELIYERDDKENKVTIILSSIIIPNVEYEVLENNTGYIKLSTFSNTSYSQMKSALENLQEQKIDSLIIDVRDNTGGYLDAAKNIADLFIEKGKVIYQLKYRDDTIKKYTAKTSDKTEFPIVVLINEASASASEILAGALKETYGAKLIGAKSFGKGTVQETEVLSNGSMIKYTSAYWLTPKGNSINGIGIEPDILVKNTKTGVDAQLNAAKEALK